MPWHIVGPIIAVQIIIQIIAVTLLLRRKPEKYPVWIAVALLGSLVGATVALIYVLTRPKLATDRSLGTIRSESIGDLYA